MTVITSYIRDIADADPSTVFTFDIPAPRGGSGGIGVVTTRARRYTAVHGVLTTDDLTPGPAVLRISGHPTEYKITIPDSADPVQLWPLIDAATPPGAGELTTGFIRNGTGVARMAAVPAADYPAMVKDPATVYFLYS